MKYCVYIFLVWPLLSLSMEERPLVPVVGTLVAKKDFHKLALVPKPNEIQVDDPVIFKQRRLLNLYRAEYKHALAGMRLDNEYGFVHVSNKSKYVKFCKLYTLSKKNY